MNGSSQDTLQQDFLLSMNILNLFGLAMSPRSVQDEILDKAQKAINDNFFENVLPAFLSKEEFESLLQDVDRNDLVAVDSKLQKLFELRPKVAEAFMSTTVDYKKILIKKRIERFKSEGKFNENEYNSALELYEANDFKSCFDMIVLKYQK